MPMECVMRKNNKICFRIPYSKNKFKIFIIVKIGDFLHKLVWFWQGKKILWYIIFFCCFRPSMGILEMDMKEFIKQLFIVFFTPSCCVTVVKSKQRGGATYVRYRVALLKELRMIFQTLRKNVMHGVIWVIFCLK